MLYIRKNKVAYEARRCCQCGVCLATCPSGALSFRRTARQYVIDIDHQKCTACGMCVKVCPAHVVGKTHILPERLQEAKSLFLAYAKDDFIRKFASGGGATRTILQHAIKQGLVDSAYTLLYPEASQGDDGHLNKVDREAEGVWINTLPELFRVPCSLYRPVLWGKNLRTNLPKQGKVLLVGLPCQLKAAKLLINNIRPKLDLYTVTIICRKNKEFGFSRYICKVLSFKGEIYKVAYRGDGWPGQIRVLSHDFIKGINYMYHAYCWNLRGCDFCIDCFNVESDLTVGDPWGIVSRNNCELGQNLVYAWTIEGMQLLESCEDHLNLTRISTDMCSVAFDYKTTARKEYQAECLEKSIFGRFRYLFKKGWLKGKIGEIILLYLPWKS